MRHFLKFFVPFGIVVLVLFIVFALYQQSKVSYTLTRSSNTPTGTYNPGVSSTLHSTHILGGFSIDTDERANMAAEEGVQVVFKYGAPPSEYDSLGQKLNALHMHVIDGYISSYLSYYECHRTKTVKPPPPGKGAFCAVDEDPQLTSEQAFLQVVAAHLKQVKDNHLISGYWVLDDWPSWDPGSAWQLLMKIYDLVQQYTPSRPTICGFGASLSSDTSGWGDWVAANFSPQGCDTVGLYIYASTPPDTYDWTMAALLPAIFASLQQRGWAIAREPLVGIGQAFGGPLLKGEGSIVVPSARDIEIQSKSFCEHGATGLSFYAWNDSGFGPETQTPTNNAGIAAGIQNSILACRQYWNNGA